MERDNRPTIAWLLASAAAVMVLPSVSFAQTLPNPTAATDKPTVDTQVDTQPDIVVTAQKRVERLQDVPAAVSVVNTTALTESNQSRLRDFAASVPGFQASPSPGGGGQQTLVIRGITSGTIQNPTVGIMIDEVPFGAATYDFSPEVDPADLQRIEVLRGPQGTLYGASSLGGLVKFVTVEPSTTDVSGKVEAGVNGVAHGSGVGYALRGAVNLPVSDTLAIRISGFTHKDPGYIDNPTLKLTDVNDFYASGGRVSALFKPASTHGTGDVRNRACASTSTARRMPTSRSAAREAVPKDADAMKQKIVTSVRISSASQKATMTATGSGTAVRARQA